MQALLITYSSSTMHQCGKYSLLTGWVVVGPGVKIDVGMGTFMVHQIYKATKVNTRLLFLALYLLGQCLLSSPGFFPTPDRYPAAYRHPSATCC
jgi:hypothetical protein